MATNVCVSVGLGKMGKKITNHQKICFHYQYLSQYISRYAISNID